MTGPAPPRGGQARTTRTCGSARNGASRSSSAVRSVTSVHGPGNNAEDAAAAVSHCRYPPHGVRSCGPRRAGLRVGPRPAESDRAVACVVMIETAGALENLDEICAVPGLNGVYVGPSDLTLALGGRFPGDPDVADAFADATARIAAAAARAGIAAGFHCPDGATAAARLAEGYTFATVSSDLVHLEQAAAHLKAARSS